MKSRVGWVPSVDQKPVYEKDNEKPLCYLFHECVAIHRFGEKEAVESHGYGIKIKKKELS